MGRTDGTHQWNYEVAKVQRSRVEFHKDVVISDFRKFEFLVEFEVIEASRADDLPGLCGFDGHIASR